MIDMFDDNSCGLPFGCPVKRIWQRFVPYIPHTEQIFRIQDSLSQQTIMKFDAQLPRFDDPVDIESHPHGPPPPIDPSAASSSQPTPPPSSFEEMYSLLSAQMITGFQRLQGCISSIDARVQALDAKVDRCLQHLEADEDDEDLDQVLQHLFIFVCIYQTGHVFLNICYFVQLFKPFGGLFYTVF
jgi:hypothetical protein